MLLGFRYLMFLAVAFYLLLALIVPRRRYAFEATS
jgi:hypothetical protein